MSAPLQLSDMDYAHERAELERNFQNFAQENPDHPSVIRAIACRITTRKNEEPSQCEKDWLDLALKEPNHPRVLRVRNVVADLAANRERHLKSPEPIEQFRFQVQMDHVGTDSQRRHNVCEGSSQSGDSERRYPKLSEEEKKVVLDDVAEYLRITKAFKLFGEINSANSTIN